MNRTIARATITLAISLAACGEDGTSPKPSVDAPTSAIDSPTVDAPATTTCTGVAYDVCDPNDATTCMAPLVCKTFNNANFSACIPATCDTGTCPDQDGTPVECKLMMHTCRPLATNTNCTL